MPKLILFFSLFFLFQPSYGSYCLSRYRESPYPLNLSLPWENVPDSLVVQNLVDLDKNSRLDFQNLKVLVWNIYKGSESGVYKDLSSLTKNSDIAILQEGYLDGRFKHFFCTHSNMDWKMAASFWDFYQVMTGVVTAGKQAPSSLTFLRSPDYEPVIDTPKMMLATEYSIPNQSEKLLVINIHGINFVGDEPFVRQVRQALALIKNHVGPVIFAGDFNSRDNFRTEYLKDTLGTYGLKDVDTGYHEDNFWGFLPFDHLYQRGFDVLKAVALTQYQTSDHKPLYFELKLKP